MFFVISISCLDLILEMYIENLMVSICDIFMSLIRMVFFFFLRRTLIKDVNDEFIKDDYFQISKRFF